ncbi:MAG: hypothetical protein R3A46_21720 [Thermomicrobiales bacterium]
MTALVSKALLVFGFAVVIILSQTLRVLGAGYPPGAATDTFQETWERTDEPVRSASLTHLDVGPGGFTDAYGETYDEAPGGQRTVQYFDKARMEDNGFRADTPGTSPTVCSSSN